MNALVDDQFAVDDDVLDSIGKLARLVVGRIAADGRGIEDDEVRDRAIPDRSRTNWPRIRGNDP